MLIILYIFFFLKICYSRTLVSPMTRTYYVLCKKANLGLHANIFPLIEAGLLPALHQSPDHPYAILRIYALTKQQSAHKLKGPCDIRTTLRWCIARYKTPQYFQVISRLDFHSPTLFPKEGPHYFGYQPSLSGDTVGNLKEMTSGTQAGFEKKRKRPQIMSLRILKNIYNQLVSERCQTNHKQFFELVVQFEVSCYRQLGPYLEKKRPLYLFTIYTVTCKGVRFTTIF